jgi:hypothetical protein
MPVYCRQGSASDRWTTVTKESASGARTSKSGTNSPTVLLVEGEFEQASRNNRANRHLCTMATKARFKKSDAGSGAPGATGSAPPGARCSSNCSSPREVALDNLLTIPLLAFITSQSITAAKRTAASTLGGTGTASGAEKAKAKAVQVIFNGKIVTPLPLGGMLQHH